ncbi:MAG TPA: DNA-directed RNA polymerase subunit beta [Clostridiales bacterium]|nr:DNA-directed RNA polymerase subunit beta [Clostridiales bacterium]
MSEQVKIPVKKVKFGNRERYSFSKIKDVLEIPYLIEVQKKSYKNFLESGIREVLADYSPIIDFSGKIELHFLDYSLEGEPKYTVKECKDRDATFACPLKVKVRLINRETDEIIDQEVFMGDFPIMTPSGSFVINGAERVVVSQLVRSPGVYCARSKDKSGNDIYNTTIIPTRGAWLEFEEDGNGVLWVHVDRTRKVPATVLLKSLSITQDQLFELYEKVGSKDFFRGVNDKEQLEQLFLRSGYRYFFEGYGTSEQILEVFHNEPIIDNTCKKDSSKKDTSVLTSDEALLELNKKLRQGDNVIAESVRIYLFNLLYDPKRYDLSRVGRYKFNKKLDLFQRIKDRVAAADVKTPDGKVLAVQGEVITKEKAIEIQNSGINEVSVLVEDNKVFTVIGNNFIDLEAYIQCDPKELGILEKVHYPTLVALTKGIKTKKEKLQVIQENADRLCPKHILLDDIIATINYTIGLHHDIGGVDNIDHLGNRRVRSVGELLQNQFRIGIARLERVIRERMQTQDNKEITPQSLINIRPVSSAIKEFFGSSQLSQFMDQSNPIAELTHKRKLSALGPGGLNRERASFDVRDVHYSHYGRLCPIETPEGQNIGLISSLSTYARINEYGFIESPYRRVDQKKKMVTDEIHYLAADDEDNYIIAQANEPLDQNQWFARSRVMARYMDEIAEIDRNKIEFMDVSPRQLVSVATSLIPFLENDDTNRALMGSNMQRQAVPLITTEAPLIGTGMEHKVAYDSGVMLIAQRDGVVEYVSADEIIVRTPDGQKDVYILKKFERSNQGTCVNQKPIVHKGDKITAGSVLADGPSTDNTELALGKNVRVAFMSWGGYNFEDAILISEELVEDDIFTSIHIEEYELEARDTKLGPEEITRDIPNVGEDVLKDLDEDGVIRVGAEVRSGDILVGKVTPKGETDPTPEERLLRAIFGEKARDVRDTSLRVPHGEGGIVVDVKVFTRANKDELNPGVHKLVRVYVAQKRKISVGDKMAGRHGNKGVISRILPKEDMPFMADGTPIQIVLNPLGVPSRMNIGQILEVHLGLVAKYLGWHIASPVFDGASEKDIEALLRENNIVAPDGTVDGKIELFDGRTGEPFENRVTVGYMYMLKLVHLVDDKIHARSTGPYSLVTQQPLGGKAQFGGQRFGEMEVWALYAYGAANILQEIMTIKSDDVIGRVKAYEAIVKGNAIPEPGVPESFKVLIKELQSLALDVKVLTEDKEEIGIREILEDDRDLLDMDFDHLKTYEDMSLSLEEGDLGLSLDELADVEEEVMEEQDISVLFEEDDDFDFLNAPEETPKDQDNAELEILDEDDELDMFDEHDEIIEQDEKEGDE